MAMRIKRDLTMADYREMERMEIACYGAAHTTPAAEVMRWAEKLPTSILVACDGDGIAGFVNLFPVTAEIAARLRAGKCNDRDLSADELPDARSTDADTLFLSCILVRDGLRGTGLAHALAEAAMRQYDALPIERLILDAVTPAGARFAETLGLRCVAQTDYGSTVYEGSCRLAREAVRTRAERAESTII